MAPPPIEVANI